MNKGDMGGLATNPAIELPLSRVILALDELTLDQACALTEKVGHNVYAVKVHNLIDSHGPAAIIRLKHSGAERVWVDAKLHDIPNTVARRATDISNAGADILTVHASGGTEMIRAAVGSFDGEVVAVTVLTSINEDLNGTIYGKSISDTVLTLARQAFHGGAHGLVCSPHEVRDLRRSDVGHKFNFFVPGIRPLGSGADDQKRIGTPADTLRAGAHRLVIGRPITQASDPVAALEAIEKEIAAALA